MRPQFPCLDMIEKGNVLVLPILLNNVVMILVKLVGFDCNISDIGNVDKKYLFLNITNTGLDPLQGMDYNKWIHYIWWLYSNKVLVVITIILIVY